MDPKKYAFIGGIIMLVVGVVALIPSMVGPIDSLPVLKENTSYGLFLGYFPMNIFNKVALIALGIAGIVAAKARFTSLPNSIWYSRIVFVLTGLLAILGLFPQTNTLNGYWPLFGADAGLHAVMAIVAGYFGWALTAKVPNQNAPKNFDGPLKPSVRGT